MTLEQLRFHHAQAKSAANVPKVVPGRRCVGHFYTPGMPAIRASVFGPRVELNPAAFGPVAVQVAAAREIAETYARMP